MANTIFQIRRSETTYSPSSLEYGELAYSFLSGKLFIGDSANNAITIGGSYYTSIIDAATSLPTANTLVLRDATGQFSGDLNGNAATASKWQAPITVSTSGAATGSVSMDGSANVDILLTLANSGVTANTYGDALHIPVITVNEKGLVSNITTAAIQTSFDITDGTNTDTFQNGEVLSFLGGDGIITTVADNSIQIDVDDTIIRGIGNTAGPQTIQNGLTVQQGLTVSGDLVISGDLAVNGNTTYINVQTLTVEDPLIQLANNNVSDTVSIGFVGSYNDGTAKSTGFFRSAGTNDYYLFNGVTDTLGNSISPTANGFSLSTLHANLTGGTVSNLAAPIGLNSGGLGITASSLSANSVMYYTGTGDAMSVAQATTVGQVLQLTSTGIRFASIDAGTF